MDEFKFYTYNKTLTYSVTADEEYSTPKTLTVQQSGYLFSPFFLIQYFTKYILFKI